MAAAQFLHGVEVIEIDDGPRPVRVVRSSVIGIVGTAPNADPILFPLNKPVLVAGSRGRASYLDTSENKTGLGTLPNAVDLILDQIGAVMVIVRVEDGADEAETLANILGGYEDGQPMGVHVLTGAKSVVGQQPRILIAPGFTSERPQGVSGRGPITAQGNGGTNGVFPLGFTGGTGSGAEGTFTVAAGKLTDITITKGGRYSVAPTPTFDASVGLVGAVATVTLGLTSNAVVSELVGIAERLRAVIIADGPNTTNEDALQFARDFGSRRVYVVDPAVKVSRGGNVVVEPSSSAVAGLIAKIDNDKGFWWSPSNQNINGIVGIARPIDFTLGDANSAANLLNEGDVATIIYEDGYRLWGNRTLSSDPKFSFLNIVRINDIVADSILAAHLWAVDRGITKTYFDDVSESVNAFLRSLKAMGAISGGICFPDQDLNSAASIQEGKVWFNVDLTGVYPAEHVIFRMRLTGDYLEDLV
jgi:phage tail sheath protein FI